jgi:mono/diheme cytochrome c family protein
VALLGDTRKWYREQARRLLGERKDRSLVPELRRLARDGRGPVALEALWTASLITEMDAEWALELLDQASAPVGSWATRLLNHAGPITQPMRERLVLLARREPDAEQRSELAGMAARLDADGALAVLTELIRRPEDVSDKHIPLRLWWALETMITRDADVVLRWLEQADIWEAPLFTAHLAGRLARRLAADRGDRPSFARIDPETNWLAYAAHPRSRMPGGKGDYTDWVTNHTPVISDRNLTRLARLLELAPSAAHRDRLLAGVTAGLDEGPPVEQVPARLRSVISRWWADQPRSGALLAVAVRLRHPDAVQGFAAAGPGSDVAARERTAGTAADERGSDGFLTYCAPCHQTDGTGMERLGAPLRNSTWVLGDDARLIRIVLNGLKGDLLMPPMGTLDDQQLAEVLTYIRRAWGHQAGPVLPDTVARIRAASGARTTPWTKDELLAQR